MTTLIVKSTLAMIVALLVVIALRRSRASLRHLVLAALFGFLLLLPLVQRFAPKMEIAVEKETVQRLLAAAPIEAQASSAAGSPASNRQDSGGPAVWKAALRVYVAGATLLLLSLALGVWRLGRLADTGEVWLDGTATMNAIANAAGVRRAALVVLSRDVAVPLTFGFRRSTIVLPVSAKEWNDDELARALRHELEHVRRDDWAQQLIARTAVAIYWPNPLAWLAWRRFRLEAERACDDAVVGSFAPDAYAGQLVTLARGLKRMMTLPALGMASRSGLAHRVDAILDPLQRRGPHGRAAAAGAFVILLAWLVSVAPAHVVAAAAENAVSFAGYDASILGEALVKAAEEGNFALVQRLLDAGVDVNTVYSGDGTALIGAARGGHVQMIDLLLHRGADPNLASPGDGNPLIAAAGEGHVEIVRMLLDRGARIDDVVPGDENALITASRAGQIDVVRLLIERGADVNARVFVTDSDDSPIWRTPRRMARRGGHADIERMLIAAGARD